MVDSKDRAWWWHRQGLDGSAQGLTSREIFAKFGWCRGVGSVSPYLAVHARAGISTTDLDQDCADLETYELPSARGCTYILPKEHFGIGLALSQGTIDDAQMQLGTRFLGVTESEIEVLKHAVLEALAHGPLTPAELKKPLGDKVRNLGEEGKKRGTTTTLPIALAWLQTHGQILRVPVGGGLMTQSYAYRVWENSPAIPSKAEAQAEIAKLFFQWAGPAPFKPFQFFGGMTVKEAKAAIAEAGVIELEDGRFINADDEDAYRSFKPTLTGEVRFVGSLDNINLLRAELSDLVDPSDGPGQPGTAALGNLNQVTSHLILSDGRLIGVWEYDPEKQEIVSMTWVDRGAAFKEARDATEILIRSQLGDARSFSLDSPKSRAPRLAFMREAMAASAR